LASIERTQRALIIATFHAFMSVAIIFIIGFPMPPAKSDESRVKPAADILVKDKFKALAGLKVGLIVNHTSRVGSAHLVDLIHAAPNVTLAAIFTPEHGLRGTADAGQHISSGRDATTSVPIFSLYGRTRKPTTKMLNQVDALIFDIQDIGARFYTYISTMGLAMQSAAKAGIPFYVLDRPNPLGGNYVSGFVLERKHTSFVGQFAIPIAHGMTIGELARMIKGENLLPGLKSLKLKALPMHGWQRGMLWPQTGLAWRPTSPAIPGFENALTYPGMAFFEASSINYGRGTKLPFKIFGAPWIDAQSLTKALNAKNLAGVHFKTAQFTPRSIAGSKRPPKFKDQKINGVQLVMTDPLSYLPVETGIEVLCALYRHARGKPVRLISRPKWLGLLAGTDLLYQKLKQGACLKQIAPLWERGIARFKKQRQQYLLY
jgi:uncharacterized protein YbbC (DUF1343 family)